MTWKPAVVGLLQRVGWFFACLLLLSCGGVAAQRPDGESDTHLRRSCIAERPGAGTDCATSHRACCEFLPVEGGMFNRLNDPAWPATISSFRLDVLEVTVGRFRAFVDAYPGSKPKTGDGAHKGMPGSGWRSEWDGFLPKTREELSQSLTCPGKTYPDFDFSKDATWTATPGANEYMPASCMTWYEAFAFCAWDGGRLPTEAELLYAGVGGAEQRPYPWGSEPPTAERSVIAATGGGPFVAVGSAPLGAGRWGQLDLGGSRAEFVLDSVAGLSPEELAVLPMPCDNCAELEPAATPGARATADVSYVSSAEQKPFEHRGLPMGAIQRSPAVGVRCARDEE